MQAAQVSSQFNADKMKARKVGFVRMKVHNRNCMHLQLPEGQIMTPGVGEIAVYEDSVPTVMSMVEPDNGARIVEAERVYWNRLSAEVKNKLASNPELEKKYDVVGRPEVLELMRSKTDANVNEAMTIVLRETELSMEGCYHEQFGKDVAPLVSAEVIETGLPEPQREAMVDEQNKMLAAIQAALGSGGPNLAELIKRLDDQAEQIKQLKAQINNRR